jgi:hypothetical protein
MISQYLSHRRFRRRLKSIYKKHQRNRRNIQIMSEDKTFLDIGKNIHSYDDAIKYFLPKNLAYLTGCENSMFYINLNNS